MQADENRFQDRGKWHWVQVPLGSGAPAGLQACIPKYRHGVCTYCISYTLGTKPMWRQIITTNSQIEEFMIASDLEIIAKGTVQEFVVAISKVCQFSTFFYEKLVLKKH